MQKNLIALLLVFTVMAGCLETVWRVFHPFGAKISYAKPDPVIAWRFAAGQKYWFFKENDHPVTGRINRDGWKDREWTLEKPAGTCRIAVIGDSFVEAIQLEEDKNFLALTEQKLQGRLPCKIELMNFGRSEATQTEQLIYLKTDVLRFKPDIVILMFYSPNDIRDILPETAWFARPYYKENADGSLTLDTSFNQKRSFKIRRLIDPLKRHSAFISWLTERLNTLMLSKAEAATNSGGNPHALRGYLSLATLHPDPVYLRAYELNKKLIKKMAETVQSRGARFILASINTPAYVPAIENQYTRIDPSFNRTFFDRDLQTFAQGLGVEFIGLETPFRQFYEADNLPLHWGFEEEKTLPRLGFEQHGGHWNYQGHVRTAEILSEKLRKMLAEPAGTPSA